MQYIILSLIIGIIVGWVFRNNATIKNFSQRIMSLLIWLLLFLLGGSLGLNKTVIGQLKTIGIQSVLLSVSAISGSIIMAYLLYFFVFRTVDAIALITNMIRKLLTLLISPLLARYFGNLAPIASGGATSMDVTLPIISKSSGKDYVFISIFSGGILTLIVPFLVTLIIR